jgi:hypothetical protein
VRTLLGVVCCLLLAGSAIGQGWIEKPVYVWDGTQWTGGVDTGDVTAPARAWMQNTVTVDTSNREIYSMQLNHQVMVTQWMIWQSNGDGWYWGVRRPGTFASGQISTVARSNADLLISFQGFDELVSTSPDITVDDTIEVKYALGYDVPPAADDTAWHTPSELNQLSFYVYDSYDLHWYGFANKIMAQIHVSPCNSCAIYEDLDGGQIVAALQCVDPWIDPETGYFSGMPQFPY